jgi:hypothetical protein
MASLRSKIFSAALALGTIGLTVAPAEAAGPFSLFSVSPCRIVDTRNPPGPTGGPALAANTARNFPITGFCGVPSSATAVVMNITVTQPTDFGDLRISPAGAPVPLASAINWVASDFAVANGAIVPMGSDGSGNNVTVTCDMHIGSTGHVHFIVDVTGYFQ